MSSLSELNTALSRALNAARIVPVLTLDTVEQGVDVARALLAGGLDLIEVTLRTPLSLAIIKRIRLEVRGIRVGAGTVLTPELGAEAIAAGAGFIVSPGMSPRLIEAAQTWPVPFLPGAATASEAMALADLGLSTLKFFPAGPAGGPAYLKALAAPLPDISFCPTGGIDAPNVDAYLSLPNVVAVGGSWVAPAAAIQNGDWSAIEALARTAAMNRRR